MQLRIALAAVVGLLLLAIACGTESTPVPTPPPLTSEQVEQVVTDAIQSLETSNDVDAERGGADSGRCSGRRS